MNKHSKIYSANMLRIQTIQEAFKKIENSGLTLEAYLLKDEIRRLRKLAGLQYDVSEDIFNKLREKQGQPAEAAKIKAEKNKAYMAELANWACSTFLQEQEERRENQKVLLNKKPKSTNSAPEWLLKLFNEDREFEKKGNGTPKHESGNEHGSPEVPININYKPTLNFFYEALRNL